MEPVTVGQQVAFFARRDEGGAFYAGLCDSFDPDLVRASLTPLTVQTDAAPKLLRGAWWSVASVRSARREGKGEQLGRSHFAGWAAADGGLPWREGGR